MHTHSKENPGTIVDTFSTWHVVTSNEHVCFSLAEMRYQQEMLKLAKKTHYAVSELKKQECLPLVDLFLDSVDQVG